MKALISNNVIAYINPIEKGILEHFGGR